MKLLDQFLIFNMKKFFFLFVFLFVGCSEGEVRSVTILRDTPPNGVIQVDYDELMKSLDNSKSVILDVRTEAEYRMGSIEGSVLIPIDQLPSRIDELLVYDEILIYCRTNNRATQAFKILDPYFDDIFIFYDGYEKCKEKECS